MKQKEVDKIKETIHNYVSGVVEFDFDRGESAWHPDGLKISLDSGGRLVARNILDTRPNLTPDEIRQMNNKVFQNATIQAIDVTGSAASVKLVWQFEMDGNKKRITDYVLLLRGEEDWRIVGKIYNEESA